jgi:hypothetical protein
MIGAGSAEDEGLVVFLGDSLAVELPALDRAAVVRIHVPQPPPIRFHSGHNIFNLLGFFKKRRIKDYASQTHVLCLQKITAGKAFGGG